MEENRPLEEEIVTAPDDQEPDTGHTESQKVHHHRPRKVYKGMWGPLEIATVGFSSLLLLGVIGGYLLFTLPANRELESNRASRDTLERELRDANRKFGDISSTETQVTKLVQSAEDFEARFLLEESIGKTAIYQRLNGLINGFGLVNSTGPDYVPIEVSEEERREGGNQRTQGGRSRFQSLFPGIYVTMTVEGPYLNLRRFLNEIENSNEYIVISTVELEPAETEESTSTPDGGTETLPAAARTSDAGRTRGKVVSLRLELAAYFQRANEDRLATGAAPAAAEAN